VSKAIGTDVLKGSIAQLLVGTGLSQPGLTVVDFLLLKEVRSKPARLPKIKTYKRWELLKRVMGL
jgi:hypothetical protein